MIVLITLIILLGLATMFLAVGMRGQAKRLEEVERRYREADIILARGLDALWAELRARRWQNRVGPYFD
jgi:hypothetical protein